MRQKAIRWSVCLLSIASIWVQAGFAEARAPTLRSDNPLHTDLDRAVAAESAGFFRSGCHVGLSLAVVSGDSTHFYDYGATLRNGARLPDRRSLYEIASVTKVFTAALAAKAVLDHRMALDGDFRSYLPGSYPNLQWNGRPITLRWLLTHRAGMPRDIPDSDAIFARRDFMTLPYEYLALSRGWGRRKFLSALHAVHLRSAPGEKEVYSNAGYQVIGFGLEKVYGLSYGELLHRTILRPLRMASTSLVVNGANRFRLMKGYDRYGRVMPHHPASAGAAWGLYSSTEDLAKFVRWQLDERDTVVSLSHRPLVGNARDGVAMAWHLRLAGHDPMLSHSGGSFSTSAQVVLFPRQREGYALLANDACKGTEDALGEFCAGRPRTDRAQVAST
jgi:D-alanyl-D-alanine-carboxypeptidase/D-alanyl-D-alanine-endopeptidase